MKYLIITFFSCLSIYVKGQIEPFNFIHKDVEIRLMKNVEFLSSDDLSGRLPGTPGANLASDHIQDAFQRVGLRPLFNEGFKQGFDIPRPTEIQKNRNYIVVAKDTLYLGKKLYVSPYSLTKDFIGEVVYVSHGIRSDLINDYENISEISLDGKLVLIELDVPKNKKKRAGNQSKILSRIKEAKKRGAKDIILLSKRNNKKDEISKYTFLKLKETGANVSIIFGKRWSNKIHKSKSPIIMVTKISRRNDEGFNVGGILDLGARTTVLIGAHYDHLGKGEYHARRELSRGIYNGADDNASGVSVMLEVLNQLSLNSDLQKSNVIFIAFSGEEDGLIGSKHFIKNCPLDPKTISQMINIDMVGRLSDSDSLTVYATSSASEWGTIINDLPKTGINIKNVAETFPRSDHAAFIDAGIPAIMLHTGIHEDYHLPSDDFEKIDGPGLVKITEVVLQILQNLNKFPHFKYQSSLL
jgi:aminopeptidase YwaD